MEWYEIDKFKDRVRDIEQFFIEMAANEEQLLTYGMKHALSFPTAAAALAALGTFNEDFSSLRRAMFRMDKTLAAELEALDTDGKLVEQVALISLRLRMAEARKPMSARLATFNQFLMYLPYLSRLAQSKGLFGEAPVSLQRTIINLERLRGIAGNFYEYLSNIELSDDEVFKPSNVKPDRVVELIDAALLQIEGSSSLSGKELERIQGYLNEAKKEALSSTPSWSKIVGALVIVAAVTSGLADAPNAAKTVKDAIEYILGTSVQKPLQRYLPPPPSGHEPLGYPPRNVA
jgi:hypothetical protein